MFQDHNKNWATEVTEFKNPRQCPAFGGNGVSAIGLRAWCLTTCPGSSGSKMLRRVSPQEL